MGSSGSKPSSSKSGNDNGNGKTTVQKARSKANTLFLSSCLRLPSSGSHPSLYHHYHDQQIGDQAPCTSQAETENDRVKIKCYIKDKVEQSDVMPGLSSNVQLHELGQTSTNNLASRTDSTSDHVSSTQPLNPSSRFLPGLGSLQAYHVSSTSPAILNNEEDQPCARAKSGVLNRCQTQRPSDLLPRPLTGRTSSQRYEANSDYFHLGTPTSDNLGDNQAVSPIYGVQRDANGTRIGINVNPRFKRIQTVIETIDTRISDRHVGARESMEQNVRFSRTSSVGRLRDRVLRQSSSSNLTFCPLQQDRFGSEEFNHHSNHRQTWDGLGGAPASETTRISPTRSGYSPSSISDSMLGVQDYEVAASRSREARYYDLLEHRSNFLERRRRIQSQVRALQQLENRFDNLSGHERSCISIGQHRTGHCMCRTANRDANSHDDTSSRASISRIAMLAEALSEVLDEIHQQSVVLSSRSSVYSMGSVPAPNEDVDSLPVKLYTKLQKQHNDEDAQCYICLVEYEEGDSIRTLPCHHEFHRTCVDKWLKEIHRVCPLCRGDICTLHTQT